MFFNIKLYGPSPLVGHVLSHNKTNYEGETERAIEALQHDYEVAIRFCDDKVYLITQLKFLVVF